MPTTKLTSNNVTLAELLGVRLAWAVVDLADELTRAIDLEAEDIGGARPSLTILRELGPAVEAAVEARKKKG